MTILLHMTPRKDWLTGQAAGEYTAESLKMEGFIHCSTAEQVARVANAFYRDVPDMVLLHVDADKLTAKVQWDAVNDEIADSERFPHIYGPINLDAVTEIEDFVPGDDGVFVYP